MVFTHQPVWLGVLPSPASVRPSSVRPSTFACTLNNLAKNVPRITKLCILGSCRMGLHMVTFDLDLQRSKSELKMTLYTSRHNLRILYSTNLHKISECCLLTTDCSLPRGCSSVTYALVIIQTVWEKCIKCTNGCSLHSLVNCADYQHFSGSFFY